MQRDANMFEYYKFLMENTKNGSSISPEHLNHRGSNPTRQHFGAHYINHTGDFNSSYQQHQTQLNPSKGHPVVDLLEKRRKTDGNIQTDKPKQNPNINYAS
jgi:hypothetical protein